VAQATLGQPSPGVWTITDPVLVVLLDQKTKSPATLDLIQQAVMQSTLEFSHQTATSSPVTRSLSALLRDDSGQDTVEYTMLLAFVCVLAAAMFVSFGGEAASIWTAADNSLVRASAVAASGKGL